MQPRIPQRRRELGQKHAIRGEREVVKAVHLGQLSDENSEVATQ